MVRPAVRWWCDEAVGGGGAIGGVEVENELDSEWLGSRGGGGARSPIATEKMMVTSVPCA
jgi:hypothetical protein